MVLSHQEIVRNTDKKLDMVSIFGISGFVTRTFPTKTSIGSEFQYFAIQQKSNKSILLSVKKIHFA